MVKSAEPTGADAERYWYGRVIGIFHAFVSSSHEGVQDKSSRYMDFLWVRWYGKEGGMYRHGFGCARLPKIGFQLLSDEDAFLFLDPALVIRGAHLIPAFNEGRTSELVPFSHSMARNFDSDGQDDRVNRYVNTFTDRDLLMRHFGGGVGHSDSPLTRVLEKQRDVEMDGDESSIAVDVCEEDDNSSLNASDGTGHSLYY